MNYESKLIFPMMENEVRLIDGKYVLVKLKIYKFLNPIEAAGLINKNLAIDTTGDLPKFINLENI